MCVYVYASVCVYVSVYSLFLTPDPSLRHGRTPNIPPPRHARSTQARAEGRPRLPCPAPRREGEGAGRERGHGEVRDGDKGQGTGTGTPQALPPPFADSAPVSLFCRSGFGELLSPRDVEVARPGRRQGSQKRVPGILLWRLSQPANRCRVPPPCRVCRFEHLGKGFQIQSNLPAV